MPTVLLVADSEWVANDVAASLATGDWTIDTVSDPRRAADVALEQRPDAVLVDMQVGSMGGMAVIRDIRARYGDDAPPRTVLLLDRDADRFLARRARADASVIKPFAAAELRTALSS